MAIATPMEHRSRSGRRRAEGLGLHVGRIGLGGIGLLTLLISGWGGIIPYVGPGFGYSADGSGSWYWNLTHSVLALVPGAIGCLIGLAILAGVPGIVVGRGRLSLATAGFIAIVCGAWFVIGPLAWPVIDQTHRYFVAASPLHELANQVGYALGPGIILGVCGAFVVGWASRHQARARTEAAPPPAAPVS